MNFNWQAITAIMQAVFQAMQMMTNAGKTPAQAAEAVTDHLTPGKPNAPELS